MFVSKLKVVPRVIVNASKVSNSVQNSLRFCSCSKTANMNSIYNIPDKIVWMDLEMTGLDVRKDKIMEVSCLITDKDLNILSEGPCFAIRHTQEVLDNMNDWCKENHSKSGLTKKCLESEISMDKAEEILLEYLKQNVRKSSVPLAGNSIYMDRLFLRDQLPRVDDYLHYRIIDVSTIKELARRWNPTVFNNAPKKVFKHRSLDDIKESIAELQFYRSQFFKTL